MIKALRRRLLDRFVLRPSRHLLDCAPKERRQIRSGKHRDEFFTERVRPDLPNELLVIKFPGTGGRGERATPWPAGLLENVGVTVCSWNPPGYGNTSGKPSLSHIPHRATLFLNSILEQWHEPVPRLWITGNSLGCATATYLATQARAPIRGMILRNPPPLVETVKRVARRYPLGHLTDPIAESCPEEMNLHHTAPKVQIPMVMLQSELDQLVPLELQAEVFNAFPGPKQSVVMQGLDHDGIATEEHEPEINAAIQWLWNQTAESSTP